MDEGPGATPPSPFLGLDRDEVAALGRIFAEAAGSLGIDGEAVFGRLAGGSTMAEALDLPPGIAEVLYARAHTWFSAGRYDRAEATFRALCVLNARSADAWVGYGVCLKLREAFDEAEAAFATAATLRPGWAIPNFHALDLAVRSRRWPLAREHLTAFRSHAEGQEIPPAIHHDVERLSAALALHADGAGDRRVS